MRFPHIAIPALLLAAGLSASAHAADIEPLVIDGHEFSSPAEYVQSEYFRDNGRRCATLTPEGIDEPLLGTPSDCSYNNTNPASEYAPTSTIVLTCVVHVIRNNSGSFDVSDAMVQSQIDILNEDFQALTGTNGQNGTDAAIQFQLATEDPLGNPTTGITRSNNTTWYNDGGSYWNTLNWDPTRYINIYTNSAGGYLGYVPWLPQGGTPGSASDRIVCYWAAFGRNSPAFPYHQGRTLTHEMGHFLGLFHTFNGGCAGGSCYTGGDRICDTNNEASAVFGCPGSSTTCGSPDPYHNYMDYTDDLCMEEFTPEQVRRVRCTVEHYRPTLFNSAVGVDRVPSGRESFALYPNRPNPFDVDTEIRFELKTAADVELQILDVAGRRVRSLVSGSRTAGSHVVTWDGTDAVRDPVAAGVYFVRLESNGETQVRRMIHTK